MNYELAKQLKDAGFPQLPQHNFLINPNDADDGVTAPTLSELINACGEKFGSLSKDGGTYKWLASSHPDEFYEGGKTPEEAVAKLYIKLNKVCTSKMKEFEITVREEKGVFYAIAPYGNREWVEFGDTVGEAVDKLWLKLNEKELRD